MDLFREWKDIVEYNETKEARDMQALLRKAVPYLRSVGYDLDLDGSFLSKEHHGSDGWRLAGQLVVREREENNTVAPNARSVVQWVEAATGMHGSAQKRSEGPGTNRSGEPLATWVVDISQS